MAGRYRMAAVGRTRHVLPLCLLVVCTPFSSGPLQAQLSLSDAVRLSVQNSPRVKAAKDDLARATAALREAKDYYIPNLGIGGGAGRTYGITLTVPTIFTVNSQSLVYGPAQRDYIRGAKSALLSSQYALQDVRGQIEEDAAATCISLRAAQSRMAALAQQAAFAEQLVTITKQRMKVGLDSELEGKKSLRALLQIQLQQPMAAADVAAFEQHLSSLTGLPQASEDCDPGTTPIEKTFQQALRAPGVPSFATLAAQANARAKADQSHGDSRFRFLPQILMASQYGRISPINDVSEYYNLRGHYNVAEFGLVIQLPLFDKVRSDKARESAADAQHAAHDAELLKSQQEENRIRSRDSLDQLAKKLELAELNRDIAADELATTLKEVGTASAEQTGGRQLTPKEEMYARIDERQRYLESIDARLQLQLAELSVLRQNGDLESWLSRLTGPAPPSGASAPMH